MFIHIYGCHFVNKIAMENVKKRVISRPCFTINVQENIT